MNTSTCFKLVIISVVFVFSCKSKKITNKKTESNLNNTTSVSQTTNTPFEIKIDGTLKPTQSLSDPKPNTGARPR